MKFICYTDTNFVNEGDNQIIPFDLKLQKDITLDRRLDVNYSNSYLQLQTSPDMSNQKKNIVILDDQALFNPNTINSCVRMKKVEDKEIKISSRVRKMLDF